MGLETERGGRGAADLRRDHTATQATVNIIIESKQADRAAQVESCIQTKGIKICLEVGCIAGSARNQVEPQIKCINVYLLLSSPFPSTVQPSGAVSFVLFREGAFFSLPLSQGDEREERVRL